MVEEDVPDPTEWESILANTTYVTMTTAKGVIKAMLITLPQVVLLSLAVYSALALVNLPRRMK
jgi:hypothetical protein